MCTQRARKLGQLKFYRFARVCKLASLRRCETQSRQIFAFEYLLLWCFSYQITLCKQTFLKELTEFFRPLMNIVHKLAWYEFGRQYVSHINEICRGNNFVCFWSVIFHFSGSISFRNCIICRRNRKRTRGYNRKP